MKEKRYYTREEIIKECKISRDVLREVRDKFKQESPNNSNYTKGRFNKDKFGSAFYNLIKNYRNISGKWLYKELDLDNYDTYFCLNSVPEHTKLSSTHIKKILHYDLFKLKRAITDSALFYTIDYNTGKIEGLIKDGTYTSEGIGDYVLDFFSNEEITLKFSDSEYIDSLVFKYLISESELTLNKKNFLEFSKTFLIGMHFPIDLERPKFLGKNGKISIPELLVLKWKCLFDS